MQRRITRFYYANFVLDDGGSFMGWVELSDEPYSLQYELMKRPK